MGSPPLPEKVRCAGTCRDGTRCRNYQFTWRMTSSEGVFFCWAHGSQAKPRLRLIQGGRKG